MQAHPVGAGIAGLAIAVFLIRDVGVAGGQGADRSCRGLRNRDRADRIKRMLQPEEDIDGQRIDAGFEPPFFGSGFWRTWCSMFGFEVRHDAVALPRDRLRVLRLLAPGLRSRDDADRPVDPLLQPRLDRAAPGAPAAGAGCAVRYRAARHRPAVRARRWRPGGGAHQGPAVSRATAAGPARRIHNA
ncbi:MAG: oleate hydratase [Rubrivivax sp.]|nr:oleate hydratase [Rubrivivax sp.]